MSFLALWFYLRLASFRKITPFTQLNTSSKHLLAPRKQAVLSLPYPGDERVWESRGKLRWVALLGKRFLRRVTDTMCMQTTALGKGPTKRSDVGGRGVLSCWSQGKRVSWSQGVLIPLKIVREREGGLECVPLKMWSYWGGRIHLVEVDLSYRLMRDVSLPVALWSPGIWSKSFIWEVRMTFA